jgi:L-seryl-tRNA(Ser) seleniumtransferase
MLDADEEGLKRRARRVAGNVRRVAHGVAVEVVKLVSEVGGGSLPDVQLPSYGLSLLPGHLTVEALEQRMRGIDVPIIGRIEKGRFLIDMRTIMEGEERELVSGIEAALKDGK